VPDPLALLEGLFTHSPVPYAVFMSDGHCLLINPAYRAMFGSEPPPEYSIFRDELLERMGFMDYFRRAFAGSGSRHRSSGTTCGSWSTSR